MRKYFVLFLIMGMLFSCSSSDEDYNTDDAIFISKSDIYTANTAAEMEDGYLYNIYSDGDKNICFSDFFSDRKSGTPTYASIGTCPKDDYQKQLYILSERDGSNFKNPCFYCKSCKAKFDIHSGKAINDKAKGYSIPVYRAKTIYNDNGGFKGVYVWK